MVTLLLMNAFQYAGDPSSIGPERFASRALGHMLTVVPHPSSIVRFFWWSHALLILIFLNYLPYSKHLHVVTSLINVFF
jgi:hypothetical protein